MRLQLCNARRAVARHLCSAHEYLCVNGHGPLARGIYHSLPARGMPGSAHSRILHRQKAQGWRAQKPRAYGYFASVFFWGGSMSSRIVYIRARTALLCEECAQRAGWAARILPRPAALDIGAPLRRNGRPAAAAALPVAETRHRRSKGHVEATETAPPPPVRSLDLGSEKWANSKPAGPALSIVNGRAASLNGRSPEIQAMRLYNRECEMEVPVALFRPF